MSSYDVVSQIKDSHQRRDLEDPEYDRHQEHRERARRRMEERESSRGDRRGRRGEEDYYRGGEDEDVDEEIRRRHESRMKDRSIPSRHSRSSSRQSRTQDPATVKVPKDLKDEGAIYHIHQCTDKQNILRNRITKASEKFNEDQKAEIENDLEDYMKAEVKVARNRQKMSTDYNKARDINDKTKRREYLDSLKEKKDDRRIHDKAARDVAREKYLAIKSKIENILNHTEL
jgi:hypothetical protein